MSGTDTDRLAALLTLRMAAIEVVIEATSDDFDPSTREWGELIEQLESAATIPIAAGVTLDPRPPAGHYVIEWDERTRAIIATERISPDEFGASAIIASNVDPAWGPDLANRAGVTLDPRPVGPYDPCPECSPHPVHGRGCDEPGYPGATWMCNCRYDEQEEAENAALDAAIAEKEAGVTLDPQPADDGRPSLPAETVAYDRGVMDGYKAAKIDYSPGGMYDPRPADTTLREAIQFTAIPTLLVFAEDNAGVREAIRILSAALAPADRETLADKVLREFG